MGEEAAEAASAAAPTVLATAETLAVLDVFWAAEAMAVAVMGMSMEQWILRVCLDITKYQIDLNAVDTRGLPKNMRRHGGSGLSLGKGDSPGVGRLRINSFFGRLWVGRSLPRDFRLFQSPAAPWSNPNAFCWRSA